MTENNNPEEQNQDTAENSSPKSAQKEKTWNSLEVAKILISLLTPLTIFIFTKQTNERFDQSNKLQDNNKRVFENRQAFYDKVGNLLNDLYCYNMYVGHWKDITPSEIVQKKRVLDQLVYTYSLYFDKDFKPNYDAFMNAVFKTYQSMGGDAKIRSEYSIHFKYGKMDSLISEDEFKNKFYEEDNRPEVFRTYFSLLKEIAKELNLTVDYTIYKMPEQKPK